jgi:hypothetical protein
LALLDACLLDSTALELEVARSCIILRALTEGKNSAVGLVASVKGRKQA